MIGDCVARQVNLRVMLKDRTETGLSQNEDLELLNEPVELVVAMGRVRIDPESCQVEAN